MNKSHQFQISKIDQQLQIFKPVTFMQEEVNGNVKIDRIFHSDGWIETNRTKNRSSIQSLKEDFQKSPVSQEMITELLKQVKQWRDQGVSVFGFRMPTSFEMAKIENEVGHFDEEILRTRFQDVGGKWLSFDPAKYAWDDGHHMTPQSAKVFSIDLAEAIKKLTK